MTRKLKFMETRFFYLVMHACIKFKLSDKFMLTLLVTSVLTVV